MARLGEVLADRYRIDAPLGVGGMATVHRARDLRLGRDVAVKVLLPDLATDGMVVERFVREAHALAAINHPAVVSVYDVDPGDPAARREPFYVMELCPDGSLADRLRARGPLPPDVAVPWLVSVAQGLAELHRHGLVHRDVKPHNVLLSGERAKLGDFGIVLAESGDEVELTAEGTTLGTLAYLAPERLVGRPATHAADVYGLAASSYEALSGRRPRRSGTVAELVERRADAPPPLASLRPELGSWFDPPVLAGLAPDPAARPEAAAFGQTLVTALDRWRDSRAGVATRPASAAAASGTGAIGAMAGAAGGAIAAAGPAVAAAGSAAILGPTPIPTRLPPTTAAPGLRPDRSPGILRPPRPLRRDPVTESVVVGAPPPATPAQRPAGSPVAVHPAPSHPSGPRPMTARPGPPPDRRAGDAPSGGAMGDIAMGLIAGMVVMVALVVVALSVVTWLDGGSSGAPGASMPGIGVLASPATTPTPPRSTPRPSPSPSPRPSATPRPSPAPSPTPALSPAILGAVDTMRTAIDDATGRGGLTGREAAALSARLADVESAAASGDRAGAITASGRLTSDVVALVLTGRVGGNAGDRLFTSAVALGAAVATA
jgi:serine/threonine protein kinase